MSLITETFGPRQVTLIPGDLLRDPMDHQMYTMLSSRN